MAKKWVKIKTERMKRYFLNKKKLQFKKIDFMGGFYKYNFNK